MDASSAQKGEDAEQGTCKTHAHTHTPRHRKMTHGGSGIYRLCVAPVSFVGVLSMYRGFQTPPPGALSTDLTFLCVISRLDKQECATPGCVRRRRNFLLT